MLRYVLTATVFLLPHNLLGWFWYTLLRRGEASRVFPRDFAVRLGRDRYFARDAQLRTAGLPALRLPWSMLHAARDAYGLVKLRTLLGRKPDHESDRFKLADEVVRLRLWRGWRWVDYRVNGLLFTGWEESFDPTTLDVTVLMHGLTLEDSLERSGAHGSDA